MAEIAVELSVAESTASLWVRKVKMDTKAFQRLQQRSVEGHKIRNANYARKKKDAWEFDSKRAKQDILEVFDVSVLAHWRLLAAQLYWCEGDKFSDSMVRFTNSDPLMIAIFLKALRVGFNIDDEKLRAIVHLHEYHDTERQRAYWSKITGIPEKHFYKDYIKPHTGKRKREGYPGCISVRYGDIAVARRLNALYHTFAKDIGA